MHRAEPGATLLRAEGDGGVGPDFDLAGDDAGFGIVAAAGRLGFVGEVLRDLGDAVAAIPSAVVVGDGGGFDDAGYFEVQAFGDDAGFALRGLGGELDGLFAGGEGFFDSELDVV